MWSLGVITFILYRWRSWLKYRLCGYPPFPQTNELTALCMVVNGGFQFYRNDWENVSEDAKDFIRALLVPDPLQRATAKKVGELERHENRLARCDGCSLSQHELCTWMRQSNSWFGLMRDGETGELLVGVGWACESGGGNVSVLQPPKITYFISLIRSGVRESPSLARNMTSIIPPSRGNDRIGM